jgi:hypothetical protein
MISILLSDSVCVSKHWARPFLPERLSIDPTKIPNLVENCNPTPLIRVPNHNDPTGITDDICHNLDKNSLARSEVGESKKEYVIVDGEVSQKKNTGLTATNTEIYPGV